MARERGDEASPDLFTTKMVGDVSRQTKQVVSGGELDLLYSATLREMGRRGKSPPNVGTGSTPPAADLLPKSPPAAEKRSHRRQVEVAPLSLTRGQVNAVRAAFKAGITPSRIARQFGLTQSDVRKALASDQGKRWAKIRINETMQTSAAGAMYRFLACTAREYMTPTVKTVTRQTTMRELGALFEKHDFNAFPVVEDGKVLGIVSKFDFLSAFAFTSTQIVPHYDELMGRLVADVMTETVVHVDPTSPLTRVLQQMMGLKTRSLPVMNADHQLEGMISREDVMRALKETTQEAR
jgi:CBS domain-containing protein